MKATVVNKRGIAVISFEGYLSFALTPKIKEQLEGILATKRNRKIVFDLEHLQFVGSTGIKQFIELLRDLNKSKEQPRFCGLSQEFQKLFKAYQGRKRFQIYDDQSSAVRSYRFHGKAASA